MRNWIIGAAAAIAVVAAPSVAAAQATGFVDLSYANGNIEQSGSDTDVDTIALNGSVAFDMHGVGLQLDGRIGNADADGGDIDFWNIGGHVYKRTGNWLLGGYVGAGNIDSSPGTDADEWTLALETQYYMNRTTLNGAVSYSEVDDANIDATAIDLGVTHFVHDNLSIGANVGFANLDTPGGDADATTIGVDAEWQMATLPVSIYGGYQRSDVDDADIESDVFFVGVRYNWGGTLYDRNRSGAGLARRQGVFGRLLGPVV